MINIFTLIEKKKHKQELTKQEIDYFVDNYVKTNTIHDYQASALLMAICLNGLSRKETFFLTDAYVRSGKTYDYKKYLSPVIDKHSLGGVGDKVSLIFAPIICALGIGVAKISGKGLGWTGGTIDKCNSVGINCNISEQQAISSLKKNKMFITTQTADLVPADKKIYDLRNATSCVDSDGLVAASVVSKKIALKSDYVYLDVKVGDGGLIGKYEKALNLSKLMLDIFKSAKRKAAVHITDMTQPLGRSIGNALEVKASLECLLGKWEDARTKKLIYEFVSDVLLDFKMCKDKKSAYKKIDEVINNKKAYNQFIDWASTNGANKQKLTSNFFKPKYTALIKAKKTGYVFYKSARAFGLTSLEIGVGKKTITSNVDFMAGIYLNKISSEKVNKGDTIMTVYSSNPISQAVIKSLEDNIEYLAKSKTLPPIIYKVLHN